MDNTANWKTERVKDMKIKITALLLTAAMSMLLFAGCADNSAESTLPEETAVSETESAEETSSEAEETEAAGESGTQEEPETESETSSEAPSETESETEAETPSVTETQTSAAQTTIPAPFTTEPTTVKALSASEIASKIASKNGLFSEKLYESATSRSLSLFGITPSWVSDSAYYSASAAVAEEILVVILEDSANAPKVIACFESRKLSQIEDYEDYVPSEVTKIKNAVSYQSGNTLVFCVSRDAAAAKSAIAGIVN